jgi:3-oxo-5alpha-steroid 4-dehydrogenase
MRGKSVVLAAGGFIFSPTMVREHYPKLNGFLPLGNKGDDGSGIRLGQEVGGQVSHMDKISAWRFLSPPEAFIQGMAVGPNGEQIANEDLYGGTFTEQMVARIGGKGYLIVDSATWAKTKKNVHI